MIRHVIFLRWNDKLRRADAQTRQAHLARLDAQARAMVGAVEGLLKAEISENAAAGEEYGFAYYSEFSSRAALAAYAAHPLHVAFKNELKALTAGRAVCDWAAGDGDPQN